MKQAELPITNENLTETPATTKQKRGRPRKLCESFAEESSKNKNEMNVEYEHIANLIEETDPKSAKEALSSPESEEWKNTILQKYSALVKNNTWIIVDRPKNKETIDTRWFLRTKRDADGTINKRKARLVAKGFTQIFGTNYNKTFAPVARMSSVRMFVALSVNLG
ncbi:uncharacterized mitochondrial protein AtMg00820-like [Teleopsis dalmanni]|uniref:uncharacterized mitochondrial protein AtMg00820-like n=1 Tax=Teleopsis dalmanni TaxID=139649 RepID=UPI0018CF5DCB|nr:uncharacterized mitochondrial protein AtMg00820-like [Teleopsis dalmanni]